MKNSHIDEATGVETVGHEWDGIRELNNPLPRWWVITFYVTIAWAAAYTIAYPAWPMLSSATKGVLGYSSRKDVKNELAAAETANPTKNVGMPSSPATISPASPAAIPQTRAAPGLNAPAATGRYCFNG